MNVPQCCVIRYWPVLLHCHNVICNSLGVQGIGLKVYVKALYIVLFHIYIFESLIACNTLAMVKEL
jgi:hypothetical protein